MITIANSTHRQGILTVIQQIDLFTEEEIEFMTGLVDSFLNNSQEEGHYWVVSKEQEEVNAVAYYAPETFAHEVYNLYFIGVNPTEQGKGIGSNMIKFIENHLQNLNQRMLLVETSSLPKFEKTRQFYQKQGFTKEAVIREYYKEGDDKIVFWKKLNQ
jgi:ribosomal protein S18 acetylase RimI-like enzyme